MNLSSAELCFHPEVFAGRKVLVIGGTSGIGLGIGEAFAKHGAQVELTGASEAEVNSARSTVLGLPMKLRELDVRDGDAVHALLANYPKLHVLVNCAGVIRRGEEHDPAVFEDVIDINLNGTMRTCAAARAALAGSDGCIINMASMLTFFGGALIPAYAASKGGIGQLTKSLALAYAEDGIRVNALAPGYIATQLTSALQNDEARSATILARTALKRWGTPAEVAGAALFLASTAARFITGIILPVDGGYLAA